MLIAVAVMSGLLVGACVYAWQESRIEGRTERAVDRTEQNYQVSIDELQRKVDTLQEDVDKRNAAAEKTKQTACDFSKEIGLKQSSNNYSMTGDDAFETAVCGHLVNYQETVFDKKKDRAYFQVEKFADENFQKSVEKTIDSGNFINKKEPNGSLDFSLGCIEDNDIVTDKLVVFDSKNKPVSVPEVMNPDVRKAILATTEEKPVALILTFGKHEGSESFCPSFAHNVRLY